MINYAVSSQHLIYSLQSPYRNCQNDSPVARNAWSPIHFVTTLRDIVYSVSATLTDIVYSVSAKLRNIVYSVSAKLRDI